MRQADLPGVHPDAAAVVFPPGTRINVVRRFVKSLAPSKGRCDFQISAFGSQPAPNQRAACRAVPTLRKRC
jgi:hypothetical protein